jgi:hypothetical protein
MVMSTISNKIIKENKRSWRKILLYRPSFYLFIEGFYFLPYYK